MFPMSPQTNIPDAPKAEVAPSQDPFAAQRTASDDPFTKEKLDGVAGGEDMAMSTSPPAARRTSKEWGTPTCPENARFGANI